MADSYGVAYSKWPKGWGPPTGGWLEGWPIVPEGWPGNLTWWLHFSKGWPEGWGVAKVVGGGLGVDLGLGSVL